MYSILLKIISIIVTNSTNVKTFMYIIPVSRNFKLRTSSKLTSALGASF